jgi:hypothetical protein
VIASFSSFLAGEGGAPSLYSQGTTFFIFSCMDLPGWSFLSGAGVQAVIRNHFGEPVNFYPIHGLREFTLLVSFGRCKYHLTEQSVGLLLQATIGGVAVDFRPQQISDRVFKFVVASKNVGFYIYKLRSYSCDQYKLFFNLWNNGEAHWNLEVEKYSKEEEKHFLDTYKYMSQ